MFKIVYSKAAQQRLIRGMPRNVAATIKWKIEQLADDPRGAQWNVKPLKGGDSFRLRVGDWRVTYIVDHANQVLEVKSIKPRGDAYR